MRNVILGKRTVTDIDIQVMKVLRGLGNPEPPVSLDLVRDLLKLDRSYYSTTDHSVLSEMFSRLRIGGKQVLMRPTLLAEAVQTLSLKALYLPDQKRILLDRDVPLLKHRWNEAHEIGHDIIPWHFGMMLGDTEQTLTPACHEVVEAEANYAASQILFAAGRFQTEAESSAPSLAHVKNLSKNFGNTMTSTLWRFVEQGHSGRPICGLVTGHPHRSRRKASFDSANPCRYFVQSPAFRDRFGNLQETDLFREICKYCGSQRGGSLGAAKVILQDANGEAHVFSFETFFNSHEALTLAHFLRPHSSLVRAA